MTTQTLTSGNDAVTLRTGLHATVNGVSTALLGVTVDGGAGTDVLTIGDRYNSSNFNVSIPDTGIVTITTVSGSTSFVNFEQIKFSNLTIDLGGTGNDSITSTSAAGDALYGFAGDDTLVGGAGADTLYGGNGNDTYVVSSANTVIVEAANQGTDTVNASISYTLGANLENLTLTGTAALSGTGNAGANVITGNSGDNVLNGAGGADTLIGGAGNDTYIVDNAGVVVVEAANGGTDTVNASITYTLTDNVENLTLTGAAAINGTGNVLANVITGNAGDNVLNGAGGADTLIGGAGNDTYIVDDASVVIVEAANGGTDTVNASVTYTLAANVENLTLTSAAAINGTGNTLNNVITGNAGNNVLNGGGGTDTLIGGAGNDTYIVSDATTVITEAVNGGTDTVMSSVSYGLAANVENLTLTGAAAINGTGNAMNNIIIGNAGNNNITGGLGHDIMTGGAGKDLFVFNSIKDTTIVAATRDVITDFKHLTDRIDLHVIDANTKIAGNQAFTFQAAAGAHFTGAAGQLHYFYSGTNTIVEGDINGDKVADFQIQLTGHQVLTAADFVL